MDKRIDENIDRMKSQSDLFEKFKHLDDQELRELVIKSRTLVCPVCSSSFIGLYAESFQCPHCESVLYESYRDEVGHDEADIDSSVSRAPLLGVYSRYLYPQGMQLCDYCGEIYPSNYSCCPGLLMFGLDLVKAYKKAKKLDLLISFYSAHIDTIHAALPGIVLPRLNKAQRKSLVEVSQLIGLEDYVKGQLKK